MICLVIVTGFFIFTSGKDDLIDVISDSNVTGHAIYLSDIKLTGKIGTVEIKASQDDITKI